MKIHLPSRAFETVAVAGYMLFHSAVISAGTLYKWEDENGRVSYQDRPPFDVTDFESADMSERDVGRLLQQDPEEKRQQVIESKPVTIFVADNCDACDTLRVYLEKRNIPFLEKDLNKDEQARRDLIEVGGKLQVPATTIGDKLVWGYSRSNLDSELAAAGYMKPDSEKSVAEEQPANEKAVEPAQDDSSITQN